MALPRAFTAAQGLRDDASIVPYRGLLYRGGCGFPVGRGPAVGRRGGIYPSRGCLRRRGVRRDEGIPPYGRFIGSAYTGKAACFRRGKPIVGADSISARGVCGGAGVAGRCEHRPLQGFVIARRLRFPGWPRTLPWFVGEGFIPPAGVRGGAGIAGGACPSPTCLPATTGHTGRRTPARRKPIVGADSISARGVRGAAGLPGRDESRPYEQILRFAPPGRPRRFPWFVGEGHGPPAGVCGGAGVTGRCEHRPLQGFVIAQRSRFPGPPRALPWFVGEGFIPPAGVHGAAGVAGRCKHRPLQGFVISRRFAVSRLAARLPPI